MPGLDYQEYIHYDHFTVDVGEANKHNISK